MGHFLRGWHVNSGVGLACTLIRFIMALQTIASAYYNNPKRQKYE
jgi:hypothetical protein